MNIKTHSDAEPLKVLIVDDDRDHRFLFKTYLERSVDHRFSCVEAEYAEKALEIQDDQQFDCILLDHGLPDKSGLELIPKLNQQSAIIMLTGLGDTEVAVKALQNGANDYLQKYNLNGQTLVDRVVRAISLYKESVRDQAIREEVKLVSENILKVTEDVGGDLQVAMQAVVLGLDVLSQKIQRGDTQELLDYIEVLQRGGLRIHQLINAIIGTVRDKTLKIAHEQRVEKELHRIRH